MRLSIRDVAEQIRETAVWVRSEAAHRGALRGDQVDARAFATALEHSGDRPNCRRAALLMSLVSRRSQPRHLHEPTASAKDDSFDTSLGARILGKDARIFRTSKRAVSSQTARSEAGMDLDAFCMKRIGYGTIDAPFWFLGAEEGFTAADEATLRQWLSEGAVEDLYEAHARRGQLDHLNVERPKLQPTWAFFIRLLLAVLDRAHNREDLLEYQTRSWGRRDGETLVAELMPLPNPGLDEWIYAPFGVPDRATYEARWSARRVVFVRELVLAQRPKFVVAYTKSKWARFREIFADARWVAIPAGRRDAEVAVWNDVRVALIPSFAYLPGWNPSPELVRFLRGGDPDRLAASGSSAPVDTGQGPFADGRDYVLRSVSTYTKDGDTKVGEPSMASRMNGRMWPEGTVVRGLGGARVRFTDGTEGYCDANKIRGSAAAAAYLGKPQKSR